jgi:asparagine synthase (glutamine-hydrolysing)
MCGIAGYLANADCTPDRSILRRMCDRLQHRGPDGYGTYFDKHVALGHRRLAIIDLTGGAQPLGNEDGQVQVVFNGEIYNFAELRAELIAKGHCFSTRSDTEVLVHLYEEEGERTPELLNGMFAFAIWDARRQQLFVARDRLGKKPLYYTFAAPGLRFCFGSELKALCAIPGFATRIHAPAVADFLALSYVPDPQTIFRDIYKLPPAHSLLVTREGKHLRRYWQPQFQRDRAIRHDDAIEEIRTLAADAVERRMISDVPLGAFLSGGVDSSAVVGLMARKAPGRVKTFSIGFTTKQFDETWYADLAAQHNRTDHHVETVTPSVHEAVEILAEHFDEPFADSSAIPMLYLSRMTRQHVTVALSGDGADELFGGYRRYFFGVLEEKLRRKFPGWFRRSVIRTGAHCYPKLDFMPQVFRAKTLLTNLAQELGDAYFTSMTAFRDESLDSVLSPEMRRMLHGYSPRQNFRARFEQVRELPPLEAMQAVDLETYLPGDILVKADRATMAYSLEGRAPWLDYRLAELAFRLPSTWKVHGRKGKYIFKQAMEPYIPRPLLERRKMGFSVPLAEWFRTSLKPMFEALVLREEMESYLSLGAVRRIWQQHQSEMHNHDRKLWSLLMLACWDARYGQKAGPEALTVAYAER